MEAIGRVGFTWLDAQIEIATIAQSFGGAFPYKSAPESVVKDIEDRCTFVRQVVGPEEHTHRWLGERMATLGEGIKRMDMNLSPQAQQENMLKTRDSSIDIGQLLVLSPAVDSETFMVSRSLQKDGLELIDRYNDAFTALREKMHFPITHWMHDAFCKLSQV